MFRVLFLSLLATVPTSASYMLKAYGFGNGAGTGTSSSYALQGTVGGNAGSLSSATYALPAGIKSSTTAAVPPAPTLTNVNNSYNQLHLVLSVAGFPTDTKYLIAISSDNFVTTNYVQLDNTIGAGVSVSNYQSYAAWGGATGFDILGLNYSTTYKVKVAALQGSATGSAFGPAATAATQAPSVTYSLQTSLTATPPFSVGFSSLPAGQITAGTATIITNITTNASNGGSLLMNDVNSGLTSSTKSFTVASATADLGIASSGYGAQVTAVSQTSGGPIASVSPYNGTGNSVGAVSTTWQPFASWNTPITTASSTLALAAKTTAVTPASTDYGDIITISLSLFF